MASLSFQLMFTLPLWIWFLTRVDAVSVNRSQEVRALLTFRYANSYLPARSVYTGFWSSWNETDETPCAWIGVRCTANFTVDEINFSGWRLGLGNLEALYQLRDLSRLDLSSNNFISIPGIGNFTKLTWLDLSRTWIGDGNIPSSVSACRSLRYLALEHSSINNVYSGIRDLVNLQFVNLAGNHLSGPLSSGMRDLVNLQFLNLAGNQLSGPFPTRELGELSSLVSLDLSGNLFQGSIPALPNLTSLLELKLDNNTFTGFEERWFLGSKNLQLLSVSNNLLEGMIPSSITDFPKILLLNMSRNFLSGKIPAGFSTRSFGFSLDLSQNQLTGEIPTDMLQSTNPSICSYVNVSHNLLTGNIPHGLGCFYSLDLSHNNLSGSIGSNIFTNATQTSGLWLQNNHLSGDIVDVIFGHPLLFISLGRFENNLFTGDLSRIASFQHELISLYYLDLRNNHLQWSTSEAIPDPIKATLEVLRTKSPYLLKLWVGGNNFSGTSFPTTCFINSSALNNLIVLDLSNSHLTGEIMGAAFNNACIPNMQLLNLSNNDAIGPLPQSIISQNHPQFVVDVSNNNLSGPLPLILPSSNLYNPKYFEGNDGLCGYPLALCPQVLPKQASSVVKWWVLLIITSGSVAIAMGSCLATTWRWRVYQKQHEQDADLIRTLLERDSAVLISLRELKKATDNFADSAKIGEGGFGTVYTGKLNDGTIVAIKRSKQEGTAKDKEQFLNEVRILSQVNHRHLVKLLGCCMENKIALLVFEFVSNGTLQQHLRGKIGGRHLSWKQRLNIAVQTADALNYLHSAATFPIFHSDVKSANILLNEDLDAKVADFGISKLAPLDATHVTVAVQGTMGYIDPEYYTSHHLTDKSDVYSFSVVLLELISAKPAIDLQRSGDEASLVNWARPYIQGGDLEQFIDMVLIETYRESTHDVRESILNVGRLAMKCLDMQSRRRPSMTEVLKELQSFWHKLSGTSKYYLDCIDEDDKEDLKCDQIAGNSWSFIAETDCSGIEMSHLSPLTACQGGDQDPLDSDDD